MGGLGNSDKASEASLRNPRNKRKQRPPNKLRTKPKSAKKRKSDPTLNTDAQNATNGSESSALEALPLEPFSFFLDEFQTANDVQVSSLELDSMKGTLLIWRITPFFRARVCGRSLSWSYLYLPDEFWSCQFGVLMVIIVKRIIVLWVYTIS